MQGLLASLVSLLFLLHAAVPALPTFVCAGMGGRNLLHPCCPDEGAAGSDPSLMPRCCEPRKPLASQVEAPPPGDLRACMISLQAVTLVGAALPVPQAPSPAPLPRAGAPPLPRSSIQHPILRI